MPTVLETNSELNRMLKDGWNGLTPIAVENVKYTEVQGQAYLEATFIPYVSENVNVQAAQIKRKRTNGVLFINIRTPLGKGSGLAYDYAQKIQDIMDNKNPLPDLFTYVSMIQRIGDDGNGWYNLTCEVPFTSDEI